MDINTTPLIDVMLVLLVMLIITIPIQLHAVNLEMPVGIPPDNLVKPEKVQIDIDDKSIVYWQGLPVTAQELEEKMNLVAAATCSPRFTCVPTRTASTRCSPTCCPPPSARACPRLPSSAASSSSNERARCTPVHRRDPIAAHDGLGGRGVGTSSCCGPW